MTYNPQLLPCPVANQNYIDQNLRMINPFPNYDLNNTYHSVSNAYNGPNNDNTVNTSWYGRLWYQGQY
jgi:hypothetical protein